MTTPFLRDVLLTIGLFATAIPALAADAPSPEMKKQAMAMAQACRADVERFCASVERGGGRKLACLKTHTSELAPACRDVLPKGEATRDEAARSSRMPK